MFGHAHTANFLLRLTVGIQDGNYMSNRMIKPCKHMTPLYAVVNNLQNITYQQLFIFIFIIRFKATQQFNKQLDRLRWVWQHYVNNGLQILCNKQRNITWCKNYLFLMKFTFLIGSHSTLCTVISSVHKLNCHRKSN